MPTDLPSRSPRYLGRLRLCPRSETPEPVSDALIVVHPPAKPSLYTLSSEGLVASPGGMSAPPTEGDDPMDPIKLLKADHDEVKALLGKLDETTERAEVTRTEGLATLKQKLDVHETIEEEILYPALKEFAKTKDIALEGYEEHHVVDMIMAELEATPVTDETWAAKLTVTKENLEHHIEEEEDQMFKQARQVMDPDELEELGDRMVARKEELSR